MIKKYVKGNPENPEGVIKALENLGGQNDNDLKGWDDNSYYFINSENTIDSISSQDPTACILTGCFKEIQPVKTAPKVITNFDMARWYFEMMRYGHAIQVRYSVDGPIFNRLWDYERDADETEVIEVRVDFEEWIPIKEVGIK